MRGREKRLVYTTFVLIVSTFGLIVSASLLSSSVSGPATPGVRMIRVAFLYGAVCIAGTIAVLFPFACSRVLGIHRPLTGDAETSMSRTTRVFGIRLVHGHHPPGLETEFHELRIEGKSYCATCFGLLAGAIVSLSSVVAFAFSGWPAWLDLGFAYSLYCLGVLGVVLGLLQAHALNLKPWMRFVLAAIFVVGTGFMLIATDALTANITADLFVVLLAVFWALSRISLPHRSQTSPS